MEMEAGFRGGDGEQPEDQEMPMDVDPQPSSPHCSTSIAISSSHRPDGVQPHHHPLATPQDSDRPLPRRLLGIPSQLLDPPSSPSISVPQDGDRPPPRRLLGISTSLARSPRPMVQDGDQALPRPRVAFQFALPQGTSTSMTHNGSPPPARLCITVPIETSVSTPHSSNPAVPDGIQSLSRPRVTLPVDTFSASSRPSPSRRMRAIQKSGQQENETIQAFFRRKAAERGRVVDNETPDATRRRLDREHDHMYYPLPGVHGPRVFKWVLIGQVWIRTPLTRSAVHMKWYGWPHSWLRYNSIDNEWDLCSKWGLWEDEDKGLMDGPRPTVSFSSRNAPYTPANSLSTQQSKVFPPTPASAIAASIATQPSSTHRDLTLPANAITSSSYPPTVTSQNDALFSMAVDAQSDTIPHNPVKSLSSGCASVKPPLQDSKAQSTYQAIAKLRCLLRLMCR